MLQAQIFLTLLGSWVSVWHLPSGLDTHSPKNTNSSQMKSSLAWVSQGVPFKPRMPELMLPLTQDGLPRLELLQFTHRAGVTGHCTNMGLRKSVELSLQAASAVVPAGLSLLTLLTHSWDLLHDWFPNGRRLQKFLESFLHSRS